MQDDDGHAPGGAVGDAAIQGHDHVDNHHHTGRDRLSSSVGRGRVPTGRGLFHLAAALAFLRQQPSGQRCDPFGRDVLQDWGVALAMFALMFAFGLALHPWAYCWTFLKDDPKEARKTVLSLLP